jgi:type II secretory ATPase GspE/PulE/Tfp pilus assembly ATPase PilB-like protein
MYESGLNKVRQGITTYAEVIRVSKGIEDASL